MRAPARPETGSAPATPRTRTGQPWRTALAGLLLLGTAGGLMAYGAPSHASTLSPGPHRQSSREGTLVSAVLLQRVSSSSVRTELDGARLAPGAPALGGGEVRYGVDAYHVTYRTVDAPVRLYAASSDTTVTQVNALQCAQAIRARGGRVQVVQVGDVGHEVSVFLALPQIVRWFGHLG